MIGVTCSNEKECVNVYAQNECHTYLPTSNDTEESYTCECATGYEGDGFCSGGCQDIDKCTTGDHTCDAYATCKDYIGSFACECNIGLTNAADAAEPGFTGVDIDECATESHSCDIHTTCTDTDGSCTFACNDDYENSPGGIGHTNDCINIDECLRETDGYACTDYDECSNHDHNDCDKEHATCMTLKEPTLALANSDGQIPTMTVQHVTTLINVLMRLMNVMSIPFVETPLVVTNVTITMGGHQRCR